MDEFQSVYRNTTNGNKYFEDLDKEGSVVIIITDLSAAFDTINHEFLL